MTGNKNTIAPTSPDYSEDDAPDLSTPEWVAKFSQVEPSRGRPRIPNPKVSTTIRLDADVLEHFKAGGKGWQTRINDVLRREVLGE